MTRHAKDAVLIGCEIDGTQAWHDLRRSGVGGSDIAKVLGLSPWGDSYSLWCEKTGDSVAAEQTSPLMEAGHYTELAADRWYRDKKLPEGLFLRDARTWAHKDRRWQLANPDRIVCTRNTDASIDGIVEFKYSPGRPSDWGPDGSTDIPKHYWCQVQWYMATFGVDWCDVVALSTWGFRCYRIQADHQWQEYAVAEAKRFWDCVQLGFPPNWEPNQWSYEADRRRHPDIDPDKTVTVADTSMLDAITAGIDADQAVKEYTAGHKPDIEQAKQVLAHLMGDAKTAVDPSGETLATRRARGQGTPYVALAKGRQ